MENATETIVAYKVNYYQRNNKRNRLQSKCLQSTTALNLSNQMVNSLLILRDTYLIKI